MVGVFQTPAPDGPHCCVPVADLRVGRGASPTVNVFQTCSPVSARRATTLPRKVQQGYLALVLAPSSPDETDTYRRSRCSAGAAVIRARAWSSATTRQINPPLAASTASTAPFMSPKYAAVRP